MKRPKGLICEFYGFIKSRKPSTFKIDSYSNDSAFTAVKRMQSSKQCMCKGYYLSLSLEGIRKGYLFREKWYIKGKGVGPRGGASPYKNSLSTHRGINPVSRQIRKTADRYYSTL